MLLCWVTIAVISTDGGNAVPAQSQHASLALYPWRRRWRSGRLPLASRGAAVRGAQCTPAAISRASQSLQTPTENACIMGARHMRVMQ